MKVVKFRKIDTCFGLASSTLICVDMLVLSQINIERLKCSKALSGMGLGLGMGWKSLQALILREPLCGANNHTNPALPPIQLVHLKSGQEAFDPFRFFEYFRHVKIFDILKFGECTASDHSKLLSNWKISDSE